MGSAAKPWIVLNADLEREPREASRAYSAYYDAVHEAGGVPVILPPIADESYLERALELASGVVVTGGDDIDPVRFGQEPHPSCKLLAPRRQMFDLALIRAALDRDLPLLAICCGTQALNVVLGGDLVQDIPDLVLGALCHHRGLNVLPHATHDVEIEPGSRLASLAGGRTRAVVNSVHHQALGRLGRRARAVARAPDGVIEAIEVEGATFALGVQWHPERMVPDDELSRAIFAGFVETARAGGADRGGAQAAGAARAEVSS